MGFAVGEVAFLEFIVVVYLRGSILVIFLGIVWLYLLALFGMCR